MADNSNQSKKIEDYGTSDSEGGSGSMYGSSGGKYSGGTEGTEQGSSENEQFGEFARTGTGTDLTEEMEGSDPHSGLIKGGQEGASSAAGPGQYGGAAGGLGQEVQ